MTEATVQTQGLLPVGLSPAVNGHQATTGVVSVQPTEVSVPFSGTGQQRQIPRRGSPELPFVVSSGRGQGQIQEQFY